MKKKTKNKNKKITKKHAAKPMAIYRVYSTRIAVLAKKQSEIIEEFLRELEKRKIAELKQQLQ